MTRSEARVDGSGRLRVFQLLHFPLEGAGAGVYAGNLARGLTARGLSVQTLRADHYPAKTEPAGDAVLFRRAAGDAIFDLDFDFPVFLSHPRSSGGTFGELSAEQRYRYLHALRAKVERGIAEFRPDVVHVHHGWVLGSIVAELGVPYVITLHGSERQAFLDFPGYHPAVLRGLAGAQRIGAVSAQVAEQAVYTYGLEPGSVSVIPSGIDTSTFRPQYLCRPSVLARVGVADMGGPLIVFSGRLIEIKGVDVLLRAATHYQRSEPRLMTLIAGMGSASAQLQALARELGLLHVHFLGQLGRDELPALYDIADLAVVPSRVDAMPLAALEALACGTPVLASRVGGLPDVVSPGMGRLVQPGDHLALASAIQELVSRAWKSSHREEIARGARVRFSFERTVDAIIDMYRAAVGDVTRSRSHAA